MGDGWKPIRVQVFVHGTVQGVGFRWWTRSRALELGLSGCARNLRDGRVEVIAQGSRVSTARLIDLLREQPSTRARPGRVEMVSTPIERELDPELVGFEER